ncbi:hypothetical protein [Bailinhaonella thermotolerans]|uniref:DUF3291 domain-containing protein n=1 Tax=Bailinhaonella thermotolerans TaxID=1070861 RepID=A0A3A4AZ06_9ACTN|nr:hypothetical protein [Bailinhaonella thermotolerans]RJL35912.1 hypothetical protein D5H75_03850 [Bailinhaonella thermotolerans]
MLRSRWRAGPAAGAQGPVLVAITEFTARNPLHLPGIARAGFALAREWDDLEGAVGVWLWAEPGRRRTGSVSVWTGERAVRGFVRLPAHVAIMRRYRGRGSLSSATWTAERFDEREIWRTAYRRLSRAPEGAAPRP